MSRPYRIAVAPIGVFGRDAIFCVPTGLNGSRHLFVFFGFCFWFLFLAGTQYFASLQDCGTELNARHHLIPVTIYQDSVKFSADF